MYPTLWKYLQHGMEAGVHKRYLCQHRNPWYSQEKRPPAPFLCTYMGRTTRASDVPFRFILNHSKATAPNVYLMLYPKPPLASVLEAVPLNKGDHRGLDELDVAKAVWKALSSLTAEELTGEGRVYGGGLHKLEPKELANVLAAPVLEVLSDRMEFRIYTQLKLFDG